MASSSEIPSSTQSSTPRPSESGLLDFGPGNTSPANDDGGGSGLGNSLSFSLIPIIVIVVAVGAALCFCVRRRRRGNNANWPGISPNDIERANRHNNRPGAAANGGAPRRGRTWAVWRNDDGLNEEGEAPPAYEPKAQPGQSLATGIPFRGDTAQDVQNSYEMDDMRRPTPDRAQQPAEASSSSSPSPAPPIATPAETHAAPGTEPPPPDYGAVTAGPASQPRTALHPSSANGNSSNNPPSTDAPLITTPPPAVSMWRSRG